jgi:hypothetical protein
VGEQNLPNAASGIVEPVVPERGARPGSTVVFFGDPARVEEGFAIALRAMGIGQSQQGGDPDA